MKVLWFSNTPAGATEIVSKNKIVGGGWIVSLQHALQKNSNIDLSIVYKYGIAKCVKKFSYNNTRYFQVPNRRYNLNILNRIKPNNFIDMYKDIIEDIKPDIIQVFGTELDFSLIKKSTNIPIVIHIQGIHTVYSYKYFSGIEPVDLLMYSITNLYTELRNKLWIYRMASKEQEKYRLNTYFMGRTDWDKRITRILSPNSVYYHCDEILRPAFYEKNKKDYQLKNGTLKIITSIWGGIYKGLEVVFHTSLLLKSRIKFTWHLAGIDKSNSYIKILEKKFNCKLESLNITCLGQLDETQLCEELLASDVFVHPSHIDNSPNSICEAMLIGLPVISTFAGGIPSLISDKHTGTLVQDGDPWAMASVILEIFRDYSNCTDMAIAGREIAKNRHNHDKICQTIFSVYEHIITNEKKVNKLYEQNN